MTKPLGFYNTSGTRTHVRFQFTTQAAAGGAVAPSSGFEAADLRIYRANDSAAYSATQRSSAAGITVTSPFDSVTGLHDVDIDLTDNTDAGFYASGYRYSVILVPDETVDSQTVVAVLAEFEIGLPVVSNADAAAVKVVTDKLNTALESDGAGGYQYTTLSLENAPAGGTGGGGTDWSPDERSAIRTILGIPASGTTPDVPSAGALKVIDDLIDTELAAVKTVVDDISSRIPTALGANGNMMADLQDSLGEPITNEDGTLQAGSTTTVTLQSGGPTTTNYYKDRTFLAIDGAGSGQSAVIASSAGLVCTLDRTVATAFDNTTKYVLGYSQGYSAIKGAIDTVDDFLDTEIAAIKAKTDNLPSDPADASDIATAFSGVNTKLDTIDDFLDTEISTILTRLGTPSDLGSGASVSANLVDIESQTDDIATIETTMSTMNIAVAATLAKIGTPIDLGSGATLAANLVDVEGQTDDIAAGFSGVNTKLDTIDDFLDTEIAAIKAKTDNLPASPAAVGSAMTLGTDAITAASVSAAAANKIADHTRRRSQANVKASSDGDALSVGSLYGLIQMSQNSNTTDNSGFLTVYNTDDTELGQIAIASDPSADPITGAGTA